MTRHFTETDYLALAGAITKAKTPVLRRVAQYERITLKDPIPGVDIQVVHWEDGHWTAGGTDDWGRKEMIWVADRHHCLVDSFEYFERDEDGEWQDAENDFDSEKLEAILN